MRSDRGFEENAYEMTHGYDKVTPQPQQGHESYTSEWIMEYIIW